MKKDWKDIEGQLVRIDIGSTYNEAQSSSTDAAIICFTTDGHIVLNGVDYVVDALKEKVDGKVDKEDGKGLSTNDYTNLDKENVNWLQQYIRTDRSNVGYPLLKYSVDTTNKTLNIDRLQGSTGDNTYVNNIKIPLVDDTQNCFFDPFYYETYIQRLFNDEFALLTDVEEVSAKADEAKAKADSHDASITALDKWKNNKNVADGWCGLDTNGKVGEGFIPDSAYEVHMFGGVVTLEDGIIHANSVTDKPTDEGCAIVYDTTTRSFCFRKKVADEGDPDLDYDYYNNWVGASHFGAEWKEQYFKGWRPAADNLYIDTTTSKAYYYNGSELVSLSGQGASGSIPNATTTQDGLMSKEDKTAFEQLKAKVAELENKLCLTYE